MLKKKNPILISFFALSNGKDMILSGQVSFMSTNDLSFKDYKWYRVFSKLLKIYRAKPLKIQEIELAFNQGDNLKTSTDKRGRFFLKAPYQYSQKSLKEISTNDGKKIRLMENLYSLDIKIIDKETVVVSDMDDTLIHSYIRNKFLKFRTLTFTKIEKRKVVTDMTELVKSFASQGAVPIYLSNSENNLYPLIYRFLLHNRFPEGPLFLKPMRRIRHFFYIKKKKDKNLHKLTNLELIFEMFPDNKYVLMGDNTQNDLAIYLEITKRFPGKVRYIIIRKVYDKNEDQKVIEDSKGFLLENHIDFHYASNFPKPFSL